MQDDQPRANEEEKHREVLRKADQLLKKHQDVVETGAINPDKNIPVLTDIVSLKQADIPTLTEIVEGISPTLVVD